MYSYICEPTLTAYEYRSIPEMLQYWATTRPREEAFVYYDSNLKRHSIFCEALMDKAMQFGSFLSGLNVKKGDVIAVCLNNSIETITVIMGVHLYGAIPTTISKNMADGSDVISSVVELQAAALVIDGNDIQDTFITFLLERWDRDAKHVILAGETQRYPNALVSYIHNIFQEEANHTEREAEVPAVSPEDIAIYLSTSGSTGKSKMVGHTHFSFLNNCLEFNKRLGISSNSIFFCDRPFGWIVGSPRTFLASGTKRIVIHPTLFTSGRNTEAICDIIEREHCSHVYLPRYLVTDILQEPHLKNKFSKVEKIICAGERAPKSYSKLLMGYCKELVILYGSTEANGVSVFRSHEPELFEDGIIGTPVSGVEIKLVDKAGKTVPRGQTGELLVRSVYRFSEYRGMPEKFAETVDNKNWMKTGDICYFRTDGNIVVKGRNNDLISIGTMKHFPCEVENVLVHCPGVDSVVAVPVPDPRLNEVICACVKPNKMTALSTEVLRQFCDETWVEMATASGFSLKPRYFIILDEFPINSVGKLDRKALTSKARALFEL